MASPTLSTPTEILVSARLRISPLAEPDYQDYLVLTQDPLVWQWDDPPTDPATAFKESLETPWFSLVGWNEYAVRLDGSLVGLVSHQHAGFVTRVGYHLASANQGKGYGALAVKALLGALQTAYWPPPECIVQPENKRSINLLVKLGFRRLPVQLPGGDLVWRLDWNPAA